MQINKIIYEMMLTSTGKAMCDSGFGQRGRAWQRNQLDYPTLASLEQSPSVGFEQPEQWYTLTKGGEFVRRFRSEESALAYIPQNTTDAYHVEKETLTSKDVLATVNVFHHLAESLDVDTLCETFNQLPCKDWGSEKAYGISLEQEQWLEDNGVVLGDTWNSYNGESNLSQTLQGCNVNLEGDESNFEYPKYILLQLHQGADVRGGYTDAKLFKVTADSGYLDTNPPVYGDIDGVPVDSCYDGYNLTDQNGHPVPVTPDSKINLYTI